LVGHFFARRGEPSFKRSLALNCSGAHHVEQCCPCDCITPPENPDAEQNHICGGRGYDCIDPNSDCVMSAYQQLEIREGGYTFRVSRMTDGRETPYRIYFWDKALTGSSYRLSGDGNLVYFTAGSWVYSKISVADTGVSVAFSRKTGSQADKENGEQGRADYPWTDFSCVQCSVALKDVCDLDGIQRGRLAQFCSAVDLPALGSDGADSVKILCDRRVNTCAKAHAACNLICASGE